MKPISISLLAFLLPFLVMAACKTTPHVNSDDSPGIFSVMASARSAWIGKDFERVIQILEPYQEQTDSIEASEINYLLGMAWFEKADSELSRLSMKQRMFQANDHRAFGMLEKSLGFFQNIIWNDTQGTFLAGSYYFSGRILDIGYLQHIDEAMEYYKKAFSMDAESAIGRKALSRFRTLAEKRLKGGH